MHTRSRSTRSSTEAAAPAAASHKRGCISRSFGPRAHACHHVPLYERYALAGSAAPTAPPARLHQARM
jgi:hypothetical protein